MQDYKQKMAPVALFVYRRPEHTRRTLDFLRRNHDASLSALHVFCDGARSDGERGAVDAVREIVRSAEGFASVELHESECNRGLAASIIAGVSEMTRRYGRVIVIEDDMECAPYFLRFMNEGLERFCNDERVVEIHGYTAPMPDGVPDCFLRSGADCWGWATWERGWRFFQSDSVALLTELQQRGLSREFDRDGAFPYTRMLADQAAGKIDSWAIRWYASAFLAGKYALQSGCPLVRNIGADGSGRHCGSETGEMFELWPHKVRIPEPVPMEDEASLRVYRNSLSCWRIPFWRRVVGKLQYEFHRLFR